MQNVTSSPSAIDEVVKGGNGFPASTEETIFQYFQVNRWQRFTQAWGQKPEHFLGKGGAATDIYNYKNSVKMNLLSAKGDIQTCMKF